MCTYIHHVGVEEATGEIVSTEVNGRTFFVDEVDEEKKPFRALLDVGIKNTTTGAKVFAALKGASDGGLDIPHSHKRFPGMSLCLCAWYACGLLT